VVVLAAMSGCSGGPVDDVETQMTSQNVVVADLPAQRFNAASCVLTESSISKMVLFGGESSVNTELSTGAIYNPETNAWSAIGVDLVGGGNMPAVTNAKMIGIPGTDQCVLAGGELNGTVLNTVYKYDRSDDLAGGTAAWTLLDNMNSTRKEFQLSLCGTGTGTNTQIIAVGGIDNGGTYVADVDLFDFGGNAWGVAASLQTARAKFALVANDDTFTEFAVFAGELATSPSLSLSDDVEVFDATSSACTALNTPTVAEDTGFNPISVGVRRDLVAFREGTSGQFIVTAGENLSGATDVSTRVTIGNFNSGASSATAAATNLENARSRPIAVKSRETASGDYIAIAGGVGANVLADVEFWKQSTGVLITSAPTPQMFIERERASAEYLPSEDVAIIAGGIDDNGNVLVDAETLP
jgi:hypothetical protein